MEYEIGDDYIDYKDYKDSIYGIAAGAHTNKIIVHGDKKLRDKIIELLNAVYYKST